MPFPSPRLETIKNRYLLSWLESEAEESRTGENLEFYQDKSNNQVLYTKYIKVGADKQVNISAAMRAPLDNMAAQKKWSNMNAGMKAAKEEVRRLIQTNTVDGFTRTPLGQRVLGIVQLGLESPKAREALGLLQLYTKPRTQEDKYKAYQALVKLSSQSKVDAVLKGLGQEPMKGAPAVTDAATVAKNLKIDKIVKKVKVDMEAGMKYYASAQKYIKEKGLPSDREEVTRMFESGRRRHDLVHLPYMEAFRQDKAFKAKYKDVVVDKEKFDAAWAAVRTAIDRR